MTIDHNLESSAYMCHGQLCCWSLLEQANKKRNQNPMHSTNNTDIMSQQTSSMMISSSATSNHHNNNNNSSSTSGYILVMCIFFLAVITPVLSLKCYICHTNDNDQCQLRDCPADQAYDRCMTTLYKNPQDGRHIKKECALAPCHLRGLRHLNFANFKSNCESSKQNDCIYCCTQDGCNKDSALLPNVSIYSILLCLMLSLFCIRIVHM